MEAWFFNLEFLQYFLFSFVLFFRGYGEGVFEGIACYSPYEGRFPLVPYTDSSLLADQLGLT